MFQNSHNLKTWPDLFKAIVLQQKTFEYRENDRNFYPGDVLYLREYDPSHSKDPYTGNCAKVLVTGIWGDGWEEVPDLPEAYCIMQIKFLGLFYDDGLKKIVT